MDTNVFADILTPKNLRDKRRAELDKRFESRGFWAQEGARAGFQVSEALRNLGLNRTAEDLAAERNAEILQSSQKRYAEYVASGEMDPDEAQETVLGEAISALSMQGNYEAANSLIAPLQAIRLQRANRAKLLQDADYSAARAEETRAGIPLKANKAAAEGEKTAAEIAKLAAEARRADAEARKADRWTPSSGDGDSTEAPRKLSASEIKERIAMEHKAQAVNQAMGIITSARNIMQRNPRSATEWGPAAQQIARAGELGRTAMISNGVANPETTKEGVNAKQMISTSRASAELQSLMLSLAFAIARANDPGGRLSNQDVAQAIQIVSGMGSVQDRMAVLDSVAERMYGPAYEELSKRGPQYQLDPRYAKELGDAIAAYEAVKAPASSKTRTVRTKSGKTVTITEE